MSDIGVFIDPQSHHFEHDRLFDASDSRLNRDDALAPFLYIRDMFEQRGISVHTADYLLRGEHLCTQNIFFSLGLTDHYRLLAKRDDVILSAFFALECPIVEPSIYRELNTAQHYFNRIFTWSDSPSLERFVGGPLRCETYHWPQAYEQIHENIWSQTDRQFLVMINSNKLPRVYWQELYTERLKAVDFFSRTGDIDLYGIGWEKPSSRVGKTWEPWTLRRLRYQWVEQWQKFRPDPLLVAARRVYKGMIPSKAETLGQYTFAICFENMIINGWITEKIFDCFFAGTVPIYWGAPNIQEMIPKDCFIDMRDFSGYAQLRDYLKALSSDAIQEYRENARDYLRSPQFQLFSKKTFAEHFLRAVEEDAQVSLA
ncbi:MAG: hypothetical protein K8J31_21940 [Anaerolineae bacterium]|nr:hypothetical protein [Anaerolineae bacterium]